MSCSAAEIAEKKRIAQERLKLKQNAQQNHSSPLKSNVPSSTKNLIPAKSALNFYGSNNSTNNNSSKGSDCIRTLQENKVKSSSLKDARNSVHPYNHQQQQRQQSGTAGNNLKHEQNETKKVAPIFVNTVNCTCYLISEERFEVKPSSYLSKLVDVFKTVPSKSYDPNTQTWSLHIKDYDLVQNLVGAMKPYVVIGSIPQNVLKLCSQPKADLDYSCLASIEPKLADSLLSFQKEGVCFGISKHGRVLIADEMGLGKTYQALAIADFYKDDWPLLICTSASTRDSWAQHIRNLLPYMACHYIVVLTSNQDYIGDAKILITSYTLMEKNIEKLLEKRFGVIIFDESHMLKNNKAKCTIMAERLANHAKRVILLSGTPALSRPVELYTQLHIIDRRFFNFIDYTTRYCAGKQTAFGWDATGQSNLQELNVILQKKFMIRRVKADVLPQLAEKLRETVMLDPALIWVNNDTTENLSCYANDFSQSKGRRREEILIKYYAETAIAKAKAVCAYLKTLVKEKQKFIVFAHHQYMMDSIEKSLTQLNVDCIRIDGSTRNDIRTLLVDKFQKNKSCLVAVLSLKACNTGITLTAAKLVVFAELDWNPSTLAQAESRAHRIGQKGSVTCRYLLAKNTADDIIWNMLKSKQDVLNKAGLFCEDLQDGEHIAGPSSSPNIKKYLISTRKESAAADSLNHSMNNGVSCEDIPTVSPFKKLPSSSPDIKRYLVPKEKFSNLNISAISLSEFSPKKQAFSALAVKPEETNDEDLKKLLNEDDDDLANLNF